MRLEYKCQLYEGNNMNREILGQRIREERMRIGLTQEQLAEHIDVSTTYIGFIERGERSVTLEKIALLAECLHVSIDSLIHDPCMDSPPQNYEEQLLSLWKSASIDEQKLILSISDVIVNKKYL